MISFWDRARQTPPILARLLARQRYGRPLHNREIADKSGLSLFAVNLLSESTSWNGVPVNDMRAFLLACGCDFCDPRAMKRVDEYVRSKPTWQYLRKSPLWKIYYEPLMRRYLASVR